jgi:hypothetical protein
MKQGRLWLPTTSSLKSVTLRWTTSPEGDDSSALFNGVNFHDFESMPTVHGHITTGSAGWARTRLSRGVTHALALNFHDRG